MKSKRWVCIASLQALLARNDLTHEQRQAAEYALLHLRKLARMKKLNPRDVTRCVGEITEKLLEAFARFDDSH
jgi:hypothetical protein